MSKKPMHVGNMSADDPNAKEHDVECIKDLRRINGQYDFLVQWRGKDSYVDSW